MYLYIIIKPQCDLTRIKRPDSENEKKYENYRHMVKNWKYIEWSKIYPINIDAR